MPTARIAIDLDTSDPSVTRLERHSYVNLINVIHAELQLVERMIDAPGALRSTVHLAEAASRAFKESRAARRHLGELVRFAELVETDLADALADAGGKADDDDVREAAAILRDVLPDADLRVQEVLTRHGLTRPPSAYAADELGRRMRATGAEFSLHTQSEPVVLPAGMARAMERVLGASDAPVRIVEALLRGDEAWRLELRGSGPTSYLDPLSENLRPSELHSVLAERAEPLRGIVMLAYLSEPDERPGIDAESEKSFTIRMAIAPAAEPASPPT